MGQTILSFRRTLVVENRVNADFLRTLWFNYGQYGSRCSNGQYVSTGQYGLAQLEKVSTKLDSARKVNHADILVKLGQKVFSNKDFQSGRGLYSCNISTDVERKFIALR